jgi:hypothetical protein
MSSPTTGRINEGFLTYNSISGDCAGTVLTWTNGMSVAGTGWSAGSPANFAFNASGDQLFVFQGLSADWATQNNVTIIYAINTNINWLTTGTAAATTSYFPDQLLLGGSFLTNLPNFCYINSTISDSRANILVSIVDVANINASSSQIIFPSYTNFAVFDELVSTVNSDNQSICLGEAISTISYQIAGQSVNVTGLPTGVNAAFVNGILSIAGTPSAFGTFNYSVAITGCSALSQNGTITVNDLSAPTAVSPQAFCSSTASIADLNATGINIQWFNVPSGGTVLPSNTLLTSGNYYAQSISGVCESTLTAVAVSIGSSVSAPVAASPQAFCSSTASIANLIAIGTNIQWFNVPSGGTALPSNTILTNGNYYAQSISGVCESTLTAVSVSIGSSVSAPVAASPQAFCSSTASIANLIATGTNIQWFNVPSGGTALPSNTILTNGNYYAQSISGACQSALTSVAVSIGSSVAAPVASSPQIFCNAASTIVNLIATGTNIQWFNVPSGGTALPANTILTNGNYYAQSISGLCQSALTSVAVSIGSSVSAPVAVSPQIFCNVTSTISNLNATGTNIQWYNSSTGGSALAANAILSAGNYYAADVVNGCESTVRTLVAVAFNPTAAPQSTAQSFCSSAQATVQNLVAVGSSIQWYNVSVGGSPLPLSQILNSGIYYASATNGSCESISRTATNVLIEQALSQAVISGNSAICLGQNGQLFASNPAGFWSTSSPNITVNTLTGLISSFSVGSSLLSYTLTGNVVCPAVVSAYSVAVIDIPSVFLGNDTSICANDLPYALFAATPQAGLNFTWNDSQTTQGINVLSAGIYSVTVENAAGCVYTDEIQIHTQAQPQTTILGSAIDFYIYNGQTYTQAGTYTQNISNPAGCDSLITLILTFDYLGLETTENDFLKFYPNPAQSNLFVENSHLAGVEIVVLNAEGKILKQIYAENGTAVIDLSALESGVYFLSYSTIEHTLSKKFIKL